MKIAHVSDIHIRNLKFHQDYRRVFDNFYQKLDELKVDLVVNTGDTAHQKTNISPEFVQLCSEFFTQVARRAPLLNVLGNHDLNLMNADRQDAITPIVRALGDPRVVLLKSSGPRIDGFAKFCFWNFGIADVEHWPRPPYPHDKINIGLFHGSIRNCVTDSNFRMTHVEHDYDIFEGLDFVFMGDIHKRQWFNDKRAWYAGSMIQQNFGEDPDKGFLLWDIRGKNDWDVTFHELKGSRRFYTVRLGDDLKLPEQHIDPDSRIRIAPPRALTLVEQKTVEKLARRKWAPHDVITLGARNVGQMMAQVDGKDHRIENLRDMGVQEELLRSFLASRNVSEEMIARVLELNVRYQRSIDQRDDTARGVSWRILKMGWNNLYNYGDGNVIDFQHIKGLTGLFAPNASGKSGLIDVITVGMFDANTKEVAKNIHLVNDNKEQAAIILEVLANHERFTIQREIERIKYARKGQQMEWGKTTLDFVRHAEGGLEKLVCESRPDTERQIRRRFGNFEDFMLTSLFAQWDPLDIIMCKETDRKRILFRFLDLDVFEEKARLAKDDSREWLDRLADLEEGNHEEALKKIRASIDQVQQSIWKNESWVAQRSLHRDTCEREIESLLEQKLPVAAGLDDADVARDRLDGVEGQVERVSSELSAHKKKLQGAVAEVAARKAEWSGFDYELHQAKCERLNEASLELAGLRGQLAGLDGSRSSRERQVQLLDQVPCGDKFPTCQFLRDAFNAKRTLPDLLKNIGDLRAAEEEIAREIRELEPYLTRANQHDESLALLNKLDHDVSRAKIDVQRSELSLQSLEAEASRLRALVQAADAALAAVEHNRKIDSMIASARSNKRELERVIEEARHQTAGLNQQLGADQAVESKIIEDMERLNDVRDACTAFEHYIAAMGKDGIALQILTQKLPVINEEINKILGSAAEFGVYIEYDPEDQSIRLYLQYGEYRSRLLELGSGAEKFLASVALRAALLSISNLPRSNMFIIDEGFGKLDPQNLESIQRMFDYLKSVFDHVIVISHTDVMKDLVDNIIDIVPDDEGYAHVSIGG